MADEEPHYTAWIRKQPCCVCEGPGPCHNHHHTAGSTVAPGERPRGKQLGGRRGKSQRANDYFSMPMHFRCHAQFHAGIVETGDDRRAWQDDQVRIHRARYLEEQAGIPVLEAAHAERVARAQDVGPFLPEGVPCDPVAYGARFSAFYNHTEEQAHHLVRLLKRVAKESRRS